ncbi:MULTISPECIES: MFS transporter [unclassified Shinella]|uniref:MFS transporter n=1 Tax=unclassified Shinella TaxID=2643062 RepID=UPI00225D3E8C|nr:MULTISPECIES: MFS transporter [unclassified Shinella]MCO5139413.1 MFS transporter [Shinella sp.]MDC7255859.1 MFS transporter [Shinella sp. YE25]CAI0338688.1 putative MFS family arabinose efflux permease [Rhizobiaceae bacterium]CAK7257124.1 putative MFS family arabinose efflux permease [Shinella sp. WSC3-e]
MKPEHYAAAEVARSPADLRRNSTLLFISTLTIMSGATISASLPGIAARFADVENVALLSRLVLTLPAVLIALFSPAAGFLVDRFGRKPLLTVSLALFAIAGASGLVLDTLPGLLVGRAALGIAVGGIMTATTALVGDFFQGAARDRYMGLQQAFVGVGGTIFLTGGGFLAEVHWRGPFLIYTVAVLLVPAALAFLPEPRRARPAGPATGADRLGGRATALLALLFLAAAVNMIAFYMIPTQLPFYLETLGFAAPSLAGTAIGAGQFVGVVSALAFAPFRRLAGIMGVFGLGFVSAGFSFLLLSGAESYAGVLAAMAVSGVCMGTIMPNFAAAAMLLAPPARRGRVSGLLVSSIFAGQFLSPVVSQPLIAVSGYDGAYAIVGAIVLAFGVVAFALRWLWPGDG